MIKSMVIFSLVLLSSLSFGQPFEVGEKGSAEKLNAEFEQIKTLIQNRGYSYSYTPLVKGEVISAETLNNNFNNFKSLDAVIGLNTLPSGGVIKSHEINQNFLAIKNSIQEKLLYKSCAEIKNFHPESLSNTYNIDLDGLGGKAPIAVYCDMETDGGGWTLVLRGRGNPSPGGSAIYSADSKINSCISSTTVCPDNGLFWQTKSIRGSSYLKKNGSAPPLVAKFNQAMNWDTMAGIRRNDSRLVHTYNASNASITFQGYAGDSSSESGCQDSSIYYSYLFSLSNGNSNCGGTHSLLYYGADGGFLYGVNSQLEGQIFVR